MHLLNTELVGEVTTVVDAVVVAAAVLVMVVAEGREVEGTETEEDVELVGALPLSCSCWTFCSCFLI